MPSSACKKKHTATGALEATLTEPSAAFFSSIATECCISIAGPITALKSIVDLAEQYDALTLVAHAHSTGFLGKTRPCTHEYRGVMGKNDIITGTLGKALGGSSGGLTNGRKKIVDPLRQRSRPFFFYNTGAPPILPACLKALELL